MLGKPGIRGVRGLRGIRQLKHRLAGSERLSWLDLEGIGRIAQEIDGMAILVGRDKNALAFDLEGQMPP